MSLLDIKPHEKILNLGSGKGYTFEAFNKVNPITGMDIFPQDENEIKQENFTYIQRKNDILPFKDQEFDALISIGVFEHIQPQESFKKTCEEIQRVSKKFLIVVPSITTILEPHYAFPFFQHLPLKTQIFLQKKLNLKYIEENQAENEFEKIRYLKASEWRKLFPKANLTKYSHIWPLITNLFIWKK